MNRFLSSPFYLSILTSAATAQSSIPQTLPTMVVTDKAEDIIGISGTASKGQANSEELEQRPYLWRGELLEVVPGVIITQQIGANVTHLKCWLDSAAHSSPPGQSLSGKSIIKNEINFSITQPKRQDSSLLTGLLIGGGSRLNCFTPKRCPL